MIIEVSSLIPIVTIIAAAAAPTIAALWAENRREKDARRAEQKVSEVRSALYGATQETNEKLDTIHVLVNNQLSQAVDRLNAATVEIEELKELLKEATRKLAALRW